MAKDGTNRGGARIGAGKKAKPLHDKILEGNPGRRPLKILEFKDTANLEGQTMPPPNAFLSSKQKNGQPLLAVDYYELVWRWLGERNCAHLIPSPLLEQYAMSMARWIHCEEGISEFGYLAKHPTTGNPMPSPYVAMSQQFLKQASNLWFQIHQIVKENSAADYKGSTPHDDAMERLLSMQKRI